MAVVRTASDFRGIGEKLCLIGVCRDGSQGVGILYESAGTSAGNGRRRMGAAHARFPGSDHGDGTFGIEDAGG